MFSLKSASRRECDVAWSKRLKSLLRWCSRIPSLVFYACILSFEWKTSITAVHRTEQARQQLNTIPGLAARLANLMDLDMVSSDFNFFNMYVMNCEYRELPFDFIKGLVAVCHSFCIYFSLYNTVDTFIHHSLINIRWGPSPCVQLGALLA